MLRAKNHPPAGELAAHNGTMHLRLSIKLTDYKINAGNRHNCSRQMREPIEQSYGKAQAENSQIDENRNMRMYLSKA